MVGYNAINSPAAISCFNAGLDMDHLSIEDILSNLIASRYSNIRLTNSKLHSKVSGNSINVKYGKAFIANCEFYGIINLIPTR